ncbi:MAG: anthranilate synthase component I family protein [Nitrospirota bacterium]|nr:anthranilate synthase component I family protein [Nitrospirota bacterium]
MTPPLSAPMGMASSCSSDLFPLIRTGPLPHPDVFTLYRRIASPEKPSFLLESGKGPLGIGQYSFFGSHPYLIFVGHEDSYELRTAESSIHHQGNALSALFQLLQTTIPPLSSNMPPFVGGAVGCLSYDLVRQFETLPDLTVNDLSFPDMTFLFFDLIAAVDHATHLLHMIFTPSPQRLLSESHDALLQEGEQRLARLESQLTSSERDVLEPTEIVHAPTIQASQSRADYIQQVQRCQSFIGAGDIYQANLSHRFSINYNPASFSTPGQQGTSLFERVRRVNPSPFSGLLVMDQFTLVSSSPERLVRLRGNHATTRPIAGTHPRGHTPREDQSLRNHLLHDGKERAEHLMLVDLARNDLGRVCQFGSIHVEEFMTIEQYSHVTHLVSDVQGILRPPHTGFDLLQAVFPGGTITGAPKIRCMEIIEELEPVRRGPYTGAMGYISWTGDLDFNILIRTLLLTPHVAYLQVGAGIVADSQPDREYEETLHKAEALLKALQ